MLHGNSPISRIFSEHQNPREQINGHPFSELKYVLCARGCYWKVLSVLVKPSGKIGDIPTWSWITLISLKFWKSRILQWSILVQGDAPTFILGRNTTIRYSTFSWTLCFTPVSVWMLTLDCKSYHLAGIVDTAPCSMDPPWGFTGSLSRLLGVLSTKISKPKLSLIPEE